MSLKAGAFSAVRWTALSTVVRAALHLGQLAILTRILTPADYGLLAVVAATLAIAGHFTDFGLNSALIQRQAVSDGERSSLYWATVGLSALVAMALAGGAPLLALLLGDERLTSLLALSSLLVVIQSSSTQFRVQAEKDLDFRPVALIEMGTMLIAVATSITFAHLGVGALALIIGSLLGSAVSSAMTWVVLGRRWRPTMHLRLSEVRSFVGFGGSLMASNLVNHANAVADIFVGSRLLGPAAMGLFAVPRNLVLQIQDAVNPIATRVGFPMIAKVQADPQRVAKIYAHTLRMTSSINAPIYFFVFGFAPEVVHFLMGAQWSEASNTLRILALWGCLRSTANPVGSLLMGIGRADLSLRWNVALFALVPVAMWVGSSYAVNGLAAALLLVQVVVFVPAWYFLVWSTCRLSFQPYVDAALRPILIGAAACTAALGITLSIDGPYLRALVGAAAMGSVYLGLSLAWNRAWVHAMAELLGMRSQIRVPAP